MFAVFFLHVRGADNSEHGQPLLGYLLRMFVHDEWEINDVVLCLELPLRYSEFDGTFDEPFIDGDGLLNAALGIIDPNTARNFFPASAKSFF